MEDFVQSYFRGLAQKEDARQFDIQQAYNKTRLDQELQLHKETMAQRGKEYVNETAFKSAQLAMQRQRAELDVKRNDREEKNQIRDDLRSFTEKGGFFMPEPQDQPVPYQMGGNPQGPMPTDLNFMGAPKPPVGPSQLQMLGQPDTPEGAGMALMQAMPMMPPPAIPMQGQFPAEAQLPPEDYAQRVPHMEGQPPGTIAMQKTSAQLAYEKKRAEDEAKQTDYISTPPILEEWLGVKLGDRIPRADAIRIGEARVKDLETRANNLVNQGLHQQANDIRREANADRKMFGLLAAQKKADDDADIDDLGQSLLDNPDFKVPSKNVAAVTSWLRKKHNLPYPKPIYANESTKADAARRVIQYIGDIIEESKDPEVMANFGPTMGRYGDITQQIGKDFYNKNPYLAQRLQAIRTKLTYLVFGEGQQLVGGRVPQRVLEEVRKTSPNTHFDLPLLLGSLVGVVDNAKETLTGIENGRGVGWASRPGFVNSLPKSKQQITPSEAIKKATPKGSTSIVSGNTIFHSYDDKFYKVDIEIPEVK